MGASMSRCCPWNMNSPEYQPLCETKGITPGADHEKIQALVDEDDALLRDPTIQEVLAETGGEEGALDDAELEAYIQNLQPK